MAASLVDCARIESTAAGDRFEFVIRRSSSPLKICSITILKTAIATRRAVRATALFTPEAIPDRFCGTELMTTVVSGAKLTGMQSPSSGTGGQKSYPEL